MTDGEFGYIALVLAAFASFIVAVAYAYVSSLQARRARQNEQAREQQPRARAQQTVSLPSTPALRKAA